METDFGASEVEHAVQSTIGDGHLGCLMSVRARAQAIADHPLEAADRRLSQHSAVVAGGFLPAHAPALTDPLQVPVAVGSSPAKAAIASTLSQYEILMNSVSPS